MSLYQILDSVRNFVWGPLLIPILLGAGIFITIRLRFIQFWGIGHCLKLIKTNSVSDKAEGEISYFQALAAALSATIGTGNIAGVASAIAIGGPGAVFWMWVTALIGMSLKYSSCMLAVRYRIFNEDGSASGGPMYFIEKGLGPNWKPLAVAFAIFGVVASLGIGNMVQSQQVAFVVQDSFGIPKFVTGLIIAAFTWMVIVGGIKRIGHVASALVPLMCSVYVLGALFILFKNASILPATFGLILHHAFHPTAAAGGFIGATIMTTIRFGLARGIFSNESGLGSAPIAWAAAKTTEPARAGLIAMIGPVIDTLIICTMTALVILSTGAWDSGLTDSVLTASAFHIGLPVIGRYVVVFGLILFAFSTAISWSYYGDRCISYLFGISAVPWYRWIYVIFLIIGASMKLNTVWVFADITNGFMAIPNLIALIGLSGITWNITRDYIERTKLH